MGEVAVENDHHGGGHDDCPENEQQADLPRVHVAHLEFERGRPRAGGAIIGHGTDPESVMAFGQPSTHRRGIRTAVADLGRCVGRLVFKLEDFASGRGPFQIDHSIGRLVMSVGLGESGLQLGLSERA